MIIVLTTVILDAKYLTRWTYRIFIGIVFTNDFPRTFSICLFVSFQRISRRNRFSFRRYFFHFFYFITSEKTVKKYLSFDVIKIIKLGSAVFIWSLLYVFVLEKYYTSYVSLHRQCRNLRATRFDVKKNLIALTLDSNQKFWNSFHLCRYMNMVESHKDNNPG